MITRPYILLACVICALLSCRAQQPTDSVTLTAAKCFVEAPTDVLPFASKNTRLDMLDYFRAGSDKESTNDYGGSCRVTAETPQSLSLLATDNISYQIFVLNPTSASPLIGIIETIPTPIPDSRLTIYDSRWQPQSALAIEPKLADWLNADGKKSPATVTDAMPFIMASYSYDPATGVLTAAHHMDQYFALGEGDGPLALLYPEISYQWNGKLFRAMKK